MFLFLFLSPILLDKGECVFCQWTPNYRLDFFLSSLICAVVLSVLSSRPCNGRKQETAVNIKCKDARDSWHS